MKPHTTSPESVSLPRPSSGQIQMIVCTIDGQRGLQASWKLLVRDKTWIPLTRTSKLFNTDTTILSPSSGFHVRLISTLTVRLDQEMVTMNCTVSSDYVDCSARLMCTGSYPDNDIGPEQSSVTLIDAGRLSKYQVIPCQWFN